MQYIEKQTFFTSSISELAAEVARLSRRVRQRAWEQALAKFKLGDLTSIKSIPQAQGYFSYTPKKRDYVLGDEVGFATCNSTPSAVNRAAGQALKGDTFMLEKPYEICLMDCENDLQAAVEKGEHDVAVVLLNKLYQLFWFGTPQIGQFGLVNHPLSQRIESVEWGGASNNDIAQLLVEAMRGMANPVVVVAQNAYSKSIGAASSKQGDAQGGCALRGGCITSIIQGQSDITFGGMIKSNAVLNARPEFGNQNIAIVYDADTVGMHVSDMIYLDPEPKGKTVLVNRMMNTAGLQIEYEDSVKILVGV